MCQLSLLNVAAQLILGSCLLDDRVRTRQATIPLVHNIQVFGYLGPITGNMGTEIDLTEMTVFELHEKLQNGKTTSRAVVGKYLDRIKEYDAQGPEIGAVVNTNPDALNRARELDKRFDNCGLTGPLHGAPILVKDQIQTAGLTTTFGSEAFSTFVPERDAKIVQRLRDAGAVVLAKTNLPDWGAGLCGYSSVAGQTKNPYDLKRDPGGSSAGTSAGIAANLGMIGIGSDTGGSIRVPASCCNLYGLKVTTGLISRDGISPLVPPQDSAGPMARTPEDLALLLDAIVGFDSADDCSGANAHVNGTYTEHLATDADVLRETRLGVLRDAFGLTENPSAASVTSIVEDAIGRMEVAGATIIDPVSISQLERRLGRTSLYEHLGADRINAFLKELPDAPVESVSELYQTDSYHESLELFERIATSAKEPTSEFGYWVRRAGQQSFQQAVEYTCVKHELDAIVFPDVQVPPVKYEDYYTGDVMREDYPSNTFIGSQSICPAISMPAGFTDDGRPVGVELLGIPHSEPQLIELASAYDTIADARRPPAVAPELPS